MISTMARLAAGAIDPETGTRSLALGVACEAVGALGYLEYFQTKTSQTDRMQSEISGDGPERRARQKRKEKQ